MSNIQDVLDVLNVCGRRRYRTVGSVERADPCEGNFRNSLRPFYRKRLKARLIPVQTPAASESIDEWKTVPPARDNCPHGDPHFSHCFPNEIEIHRVTLGRQFGPLRCYTFYQPLFARLPPTLALIRCSRVKLKGFRHSNSRLAESYRSRKSTASAGVTLVRCEPAFLTIMISRTQTSVALNMRLMARATGQ